MPSRRKMPKFGPKWAILRLLGKRQLNSLILSIIACAISTALVLMSADP